jgi:hypothetical protein
MQSSLHAFSYNNNKTLKVCIIILDLGMKDLRLGDTDFLHILFCST